MNIKIENACVDTNIHKYKYSFLDMVAPYMHTYGYKRRCMHPYIKRNGCHRTWINMVPTYMYICLWTSTCMDGEENKGLT